MNALVITEAPPPFRIGCPSCAVIKVPQCAAVTEVSDAVPVVPEPRRSITSSWRRT
jgi:hypothetical protein